MTKTAVNRTGALSRLTVAALTAALVATGTSAVAADGPGTTPSKAGKAAAAFTKAGKAKAPAESGKSAAANVPGEFRWLHALDGSTVYEYAPDNAGGYQPRSWATDQWTYVRHAQQVDSNGDNAVDSLWVWDTDGYMAYSSPTDFAEVGHGWNIYNKIISTGNLGGAPSGDLIARDAAGDLWLYLGYADGRITARQKIGAGWNIYKNIAGSGDYTGDGKQDIVAADNDGVLWLHPGTGDYTKPFAPRVRVGGGWNTFNNLVGVGDLDRDGTNDMIARGTDGTLWRYSGAGNTTAPFKPRAQIGTGGWNSYRLMF
ncbi:VCBS repeat-containing protein [Streptomyces sp. NPDC020875]|uniref:FG-GAP repeat domain-containing protein n=1 Tax=Streptomyces sp. NPDC020875 TaxID=3154898 RepID=UPI0033BFC9C0